MFSFFFFFCLVFSFFFFLFGLCFFFFFCFVWSFFPPPEEMNDEEDHSIPPELTELLGVNPLPVPKNPALNDGLAFPFHINRGRHETVGEGIFPSKDSVDTLINHDFEHSLSKQKEPEEVQGSADVALSIKCDDKVMTVAVEKDSLQVGVISLYRVWADFFFYLYIDGETKHSKTYRHHWPTPPKISFMWELYSGSCFLFPAVWYFVKGFPIKALQSCFCQKITVLNHQLEFLISGAQRGCF